MILLAFTLLFVLVFSFADFFYRVFLSFFVAYLIAAIAATFYMAYCFTIGVHPSAGIGVAFSRTKERVKRLFSWKKKAHAPVTPS